MITENPQKVLKALGKDWDFADERITVSGFKYFIQTKQASGAGGKAMDVPVAISCSGMVESRREFLYRVTLIVKIVTQDGFVIGTVEGSARCLERGEKWNFCGRSEDLAVYDSMYGHGGPRTTREYDTGDILVRIYANEETSCRS